MEISSKEYITGDAYPLVSHPERILFPDVGVNRETVLKYYAEVGPYLIEQAKDRALMVKRWPHGLTGHMFYQKHPPSGGPIVLESLQEVFQWVAAGTIEWHAPLGTRGQPSLHDWAVMDLDPNPPASWKTVLKVAKIFKALLDLQGIPFLLKTSGQSGLHFYIPIVSMDQAQVTEIVKSWAEVVTRTAPDLATVARFKKDRGARVYLDYLQNGGHRTTVMAYSLRATPTATISMPIGWSEAPRDPQTWTIGEVTRHLRRHGNLFTWDKPRVPLNQTRLAEVISRTK